MIYPMMRAAAVRMCFPSPSGFGGIGETGKVTGVTAEDRDVFDSDIFRWPISRRMILTGTIRLRVWVINGETDLEYTVNGLRIRIPVQA